MICKFPFVEVGISHTITLSRTRLPYLAHDYPYLVHDYSHLAHDYSHLVHDYPISHTISESVEMGVLL